MKQGDQPQHLFLVQRGRFKMTSLGQDGSQKTLRFMNPGDIIGCAAVFSRFPYPATATAIADSAVIAWTTPQMDSLLREFPQLAANALAIVGGRTEEMLQRLREVTSESVEQRIARALVRLAQQDSVTTSDGVITISISRQDLAELSDSSLFTVSRTVSSWVRAGVLQGGRERIRIRDLNRLIQLCDKPAPA